MIDDKSLVDYEKSLISDGYVATKTCKKCKHPTDFIKTGGTSVSHIHVHMKNCEDKLSASTAFSAITNIVLGALGLIYFWHGGVENTIIGVFLMLTVFIDLAARKIVRIIEDNKV